MTVVMLIAGLVVLTLGAEALVRGAGTLARRFGIPALIVGLTVVAFGTSAPELAVSVGATLMGQSDLAVGNVVGSNIFNVLFILGLSALIVPLLVSSQLIRLDVPIMIGASGLLWWMALDGQIGQLEGFVLVGLLVGYIVVQILLGLRESRGASEEEREGRTPLRAGGLVLDGVLIVTGLGALALGANWFNGAAVSIARYLGVSELIIGLTIVAAGTSLPEVATSVMASIRGERDMAVGNVVGSNIFNILGVLGISTIVSTGGITVAPSLFDLDLPLMLFVGIVCLPIFLSGSTISRAEGALLLAGYVVYTTLLVLDATGSPWVAQVRLVTCALLIPIALIVLVREFRPRQTKTP